MLRIIRTLRELLKLLLNEVTDVGRQFLRNVVDGRLLTVDNSEAVRDESSIIARQSCELRCQFVTLSVVFALLTRIEANVFKEQDIAIIETVGTFVCVFAGNIRCQCNLLV